MVKHWAKIIDDEKKLVEVGLGDDSKYYESIGMKKMEVAEGSDGRWYVKGYEPGHSIPSSKQKRIDELKKLLSQWDYVGVKIATGCATIEDYKDVIDMCEAYRQEIRILSGGDDANS